MADPTVTKVEAQVVAAVAASESPVLAFIKAHYAKVAYAVIGAVVFYFVKKII